ncbi:hypothetical protein GFS31_03080 [Leptolyngbya sp. BL0902]|uniref:tetratricopeptide repeat protein n=1 Tax=Leptolyngbya sp. BL0902 TaxID=1115757 RepID=UPI0018E74009|nr:tetratricopeptide repeat protein [Leptolyngbya sp. BL0902]QQE63640.1 hypothetical protein GFS31_03080 [Leptolyngbya sp. BL0902]
MTISELLKAGIEKAKLGYFQDALAIFTQVLRLDGACAKAYYNRGCAYRDLNQYRQALDDFSTALSLDPQLASAYINRGNVYYLMGELAAGLADLDRAIALQPSALKAYGSRGRLKLDMADYRGAIADFSRVLDAQPQFVKVLLWRGLAYLKQGTHLPSADQRHPAYQRAIEDFSALLARQPHHAEALNYRAVAHFQLRNYYQATLDLNQALHHRPDYAEAYVNRGTLRHEMGDDQGAIDDYTAVLTLYPALQDRAYNQTLVGLSLAKLDHTSREDPSRNLRFRLADLYDSRGHLHAQMGDLAEANADYTLALRFNPRSGHLLANRGRVLSRQGQYQAALADFDAALALSTEDALVYCDRGYAHYFLGAWEQALADFNQALALNPDLAEAYLGRGHTQIRLAKRANAALSDFRKTLELSWDSRQLQRSRPL